MTSKKVSGANKKLSHSYGRTYLGHSSCTIQDFRIQVAKNGKTKTLSFFLFIYWFFFCYWANMHSPVDSGTPWPPWTSSPDTRTSCTPRPPNRRQNVRPSARCASSLGVCAADTCASNSTPTVIKHKTQRETIFYFAEQELEILRLSINPSEPIENSLQNALPASLSHASGKSAVIPLIISSSYTVCRMYMAPVYYTITPWIHSIFGLPPSPVPFNSCFARHRLVPFSFSQPCCYSYTPRLYISTQRKIEKTKRKIS